MAVSPLVPNCLLTDVTAFMSLVGLRLSRRYETSQITDVQIVEYQLGQVAQDALLTGKNFLKYVYVVS